MAFRADVGIRREAFRCGGGRRGRKGELGGRRLRLLLAFARQVVGGRLSFPRLGCGRHGWRGVRVRVVRRGLGRAPGGAGGPLRERGCLLSRRPRRLVQARLPGLRRWLLVVLRLLLLRVCDVLLLALLLLLFAVRGQAVLGRLLVLVRSGPFLLRLLLWPLLLLRLVLLRVLWRAEWRWRLPRRFDARSGVVRWGAIAAFSGGRAPHQAFVTLERLDAAAVRVDRILHSGFLSAEVGLEPGHLRGGLVKRRAERDNLIA